MRRTLARIFVAGVVALTGCVGGEEAPVVDVYKTRTCGCCRKWVEHLRAHGFTVRTTDVRNLEEIEARSRVPAPVRSCHTAVVDGYIVEGHVPAADVHRLLEARPAVAGVAVPGMPAGSPGMEVAGRRAEPYEVLAFDEGGKTEVFASHGQE